MKYASLDTEYTSWKGSFERNWSYEWETKEIVQVGISFLDENFDLKKTTCIYLKPQINNILSDYFKNLTGITQSRVDSAIDNIFDIRNFILELSKKGYQFISWGPDLDIINQNIKLYKRDSSLIKIEYVDMALLCEKLNICHDNLSSGTIYNFLTQKPLTSKTNHDAASDSQEVAKAFKFLIKSGMVLESQINNFKRWSN